MKFRMAVVALAMVGLVATAFVGAEEKKATKKKDPLEGVKCPLSGRAIDVTKTVAYKDAKVYFCCENCPKGFAKDPAKHAVKANYQLVLTKQAKQQKCPLSGRDLNKETKIKVVGVSVAFCCENCQGKVAGMKDKEKEQLALVFNDKAFEKAFKIVKKKKDDLEFSGLFIP